MSNDDLYSSLSFCWLNSDCSFQNQTTKIKREQLSAERKYL